MQRFTNARKMLHAQIGAFGRGLRAALKDAKLVKVDSICNIFERQHFIPIIIWSLILMTAIYGTIHLGIHTGQQYYEKKVRSVPIHME